MFDSLQKQADIIARGNPDLKQDILAMSFDSYQRALERGKTLSIGELVNLMKYRAGGLRSGSRLPFGNISNRTTQDVYHKRNYFDGKVELLSLEFDDLENPGDGKGVFNLMASTGDFADTVLFNIEFQRYLSLKSSLNRRILELRYEGYSLKEISALTGCSVQLIRRELEVIEADFVVHFGIV
jgi:hypothetical protein